MGRGGYKRNRGGRRRDNPRSTTNGSFHKSYPEIVKENERLQQYYNGLLELNDKDEEREALWAAFRRELPHSFRFCGSKGHALAVQRLLQTRYIPELAKISHYDGLPVSPPQPVPWYPDSLAWWMTTPKTVIRKFPPFAAFQKFLVSETTVGNISRQEVVSMIPPLLLDVQPGMAVLDLCAAPGSKAAQLLEMIHRGEEARVRKVLRAMEQGLAGGAAGAEKEAEKAAEKEADKDDDDDDPAAKLSADPSDDGRATGVLIANDSDYKRSQLLIHQLKRLSSPNIIVTNHDATVYPSLRLPPLPEPAQPAGTKRPPPVRYLKFDRILADVPCSGDGTLRKNVTMWKDWTPASALGLHLVQVRILVRALQMLRPGGRVVYSTCSLNPVENESVVAAAIEMCGGPSRVAILDSSDQLPLLKRRPGLKRWPVMDKGGRLWQSWAEVEAFVRSEEESGGLAPSRVVPTMFASAESDKLPLERCIRVYPHLQDTGGFFIVALEKLAEFKLKSTHTSNVADSAGVQKQKESADGAAEDGDDNNNNNNNKPTKKEAGGGGASTAEVAETETEAGTETGVEIETETETETETGERSAAAAKRPAEDEVDVQAGQDSDLPFAKKQKQMQDAAAAAAAVSAISVVAEDTEMLDAEKEPVEAAEDAPAEIVEADETAAAGSGAPARLRHSGPYEEPFKYLATDHPVVEEIRQFYKLSPRFPLDRFMVRNAYGEPAKGIYYTSELVRDILVSNSSDGSPQQRKQQQQQQVRVKFVHGGVRMFVKQEAPSTGVCRWRIQSEGMPLLQGYVGEERVVRLHRKATLRALLVEMFPKFVDGGWKQLGEVGRRLPEIGMGCFVLKVEPGEEDEDEEAREETDANDEHKEHRQPPKLDDGVALEPMALPLWKSFHSLNLMLPKEDRAAMLLRIFNDTTPLVNNTLERNKKQQQMTATAASVEPEADSAAGPSVADGSDAQLNDYDAEDAPSS